MSKLTHCSTADTQNNQKTHHFIHSEQWRGQFYSRTWALQCCGLGTIEGFTTISALLEYHEVSFAEIVSVLLKAQGKGGIYKPWNYIYCISNIQLDCRAHKEFLKLGAVQMGDPFKNEAHGPCDLFIFRVNLKNALDKIVDRNYEPIIQKKETNDDNSAASQAVSV